MPVSGSPLAAFRPLVIDPFVQQGAKLVGGPASGRYVGEGRSVALSDDGTTALIGAPGLNSLTGGAFVFVRSGSIWTQQGPALVGSGANGEANEGVSVALSADGNTALVAGSSDGGGTGAAWVFTRSGSTWTQQAELGAGSTGTTTGEVGVALSADGNTALVGEPGVNGFAGAVFVFTRSGAMWTQQGPPLVANCNSACSGANGTGESGSGNFGTSVSLSRDGNTALIGAPVDGSPYQDTVGPGAAWVFTRSGSTWSQQGPKLVGTSGVGNSAQGDAVALSGDGNTALVSGSGDGDSGGLPVGAEWVFVRSGSTWTQQGAKLVGTLISGYGQGGVSLSDDGNTALIGGPGTTGSGAAAIFTRSGSAWTEQQQIAGSDSAGTAEQGSSVALSGNAGTALIGGPSDSGSLGAAWAFAIGPSLTVAVTGSGSGSVSGGGITCPGDCSEGVTIGSKVTLTATPTPGSTFAGWSGGGCSGTGSCQVQVNADTTITATFTRFPTLSISLSGHGVGKVKGADISCPTTCSKALPPGTVITLTATADPGSAFVGWSGGGCSNRGACHLTLNDDTNVSAAFGRLPHCTLTPRSKVHMTANDKRKGESVGSVSLGARCDQPVVVKLAGVVTEMARQHGKPRTHRIHLRTVSRSLRSGASASLTVKLPSVALTGLSHGDAESLNWTLVATSSIGQSTTHARVARLRRG